MNNLTYVTHTGQLDELMKSSELVVLFLYSKKNLNWVQMIHTIQDAALSVKQQAAEHQPSSRFGVIDIDTFQGASQYFDWNNRCLPRCHFYYQEALIGSCFSSDSIEIKNQIKLA